MKRSFRWFRWLVRFPIKMAIKMSSRQFFFASRLRWYRLSLLGRARSLSGVLCHDRFWRGPYHFTVFHARLWQACFLQWSLTFFDRNSYGKLWQETKPQTMVAKLSMIDRNLWFMNYYLAFSRKGIYQFTQNLDSSHLPCSGKMIDNNHSEWLAF